MKIKNTFKEDEKPQTPEAAWRKPIKLPSIKAKNPIEQLYRPTSPSEQNNSSETETTVTAHEAVAAQQIVNTKPLANTKSNKTSETIREIEINPTVTATSGETKPPTKQAKSQNRAAHELAQLLRTENLESLYSLQEVLRGTSMILYCILYSASRRTGRCQMRSSELMMRSGISNPATLHKQERWLAQLGLISKNFRLGSHDGAGYEVFELDTLPLPEHILEQFDGYLAKYQS